MPRAHHGRRRPKLHAWHDYLTDHGGTEGCPEIEEEIDIHHLEWTRRQVHRVLSAEASRFGPRGASRVALIGQSQGSCCALDAALTHRSELRGVFCSIGQLYSHTPVDARRKAMPIVTFNGAADRCIAASLAMRSYARLLDAGFDQMTMHVQPSLGHQGSTAAEAALLATALRDWGLLSPPPAAGGPAGEPPAAAPAGANGPARDATAGTAAKPMHSNRSAAKEASKRSPGTAAKSPELVAAKVAAAKASKDERRASKKGVAPCGDAHGSAVDERPPDADPRDQAATSLS